MSAFRAKADIESGSFLLSYCAHCNYTACLNDGEKETGGSDGGPFDHAPHGAGRGEHGCVVTHSDAGDGTGKRDAIAKKTYIRAPKYPQTAFDKALADCKAGGGWQTFINDNSGHDVMIDQRAWLADLLLKVS
jgi:hypothetical protein